MQDFGFCGVGVAVIRKGWFDYRVRVYLRPDDDAKSVDMPHRFFRKRTASAAAFFLFRDLASAKIAVSVVQQVLPGFVGPLDSETVGDQS